MNSRSPLGQLVVFVVVLVILNLVLQLFGAKLQINVIGSIVLTIVVGGIMGLTRR
jgi:hypothetical protein